jgi:hypothetical protein
MLYKWYVYELADPRDGSVFYVGKGSGKRIDAHEQEARRGVCSYKCNKIRHLWAQNVTIQKTIVAYFNDEQAAYDHEAERIASYEHTTNVIGGPCGRFVGPMPKVAEKPKELSIGKAVEMLLIRPDILAEFFKFTKGKRGKVSVSISGFNGVWNRMLEFWYTGMFNTIYPMCLDKVIDSPTDWKKVQNALLPYGVILENGSTNESNEAYA